MFAHKNRGFSLLELMMVVAVAAVLINVALPSLTILAYNQERRGALHDLIGVFAFARQHAVMHGEIITVCPLDGNGACGKDWNGEIHAFVDSGNTRKLSANENLLRTISPASNGYFIVRSLHRSYFQFRPTGFIHSDLGNITWCPKSRDASLAGQIIVSRGGRVRVARDTDNDGIPEDARGRPLRC
ncbi:GspH/FimT family pseudopilin [Marinobacter aromaticivorans]|uniref:Type II secretion system protein H n=1 Tax=Marinobacter aromaticivorans TaxID=1494078 RepID=A0ABW2IX62_9GAMM